MRKFAVLLSALLLPPLAGAATVTYNTALEQVNGTISKIGLDPAANFLVVGTTSAGAAVISISPSGALNWTWLVPSTATLNAPASVFGIDGSTYLVGNGLLSIPNAPILYVGANVKPSFIAKIDSSGNPVSVSYLGDDTPTAIALDSSGNLYATGSGDTSGFTAKINPALNTVLYINNSIAGQLIAAGPNGEVVLEVRALGFGPGLGIVPDQFLQTTVVLDSNGNQLYSSPGAYLHQFVNSMQVDGAGNIYLAGSVTGNFLPVTTDAIQPFFPSLPVDAGALAPPSGICLPDLLFGGQDCTFNGSPSPAAGQISGFVSVLSADASTILYSTYFGGTGATTLSTLSIDETNSRILLAGYTNSSDTPGLDPSNARCIPSIFSAELSLDGSSVLPTVPAGFSVPANSSAIYPSLVGVAPAYPAPAMVELPSGVVALAYSDPDVALVNRSTSSPVACLTNSPDLHPTRTVAPGQLLTIFGSGLEDRAWIAAPMNGQYPTASPDQLSITVNGVPAPLLYTSPDQINVQIPFEISGSSAASLVLSSPALGSVSQNLRVVASNPTVFEVPVEPGDCLTSWAGEMNTIAKNADGTRSSCENPAQPGSVVRFYLNGLGLVDGPQTTGALIQKGATASVQASLGVAPPNGWSLVDITPLFGSITGMYAVDINVGTSGYDVAAYLGLNGMQTTDVVDIRVVPDATQISAINPEVKRARR
jgi:uncharacterized protein (TIGR03437 family)